MNMPRKIKQSPEDFTELELMEYRPRLRDMIYEFVVRVWNGNNPAQPRDLTTAMPLIRTKYGSMYRRLFGMFVDMEHWVKEDPRLYHYITKRGTFVFAPRELLFRRYKDIDSPENSFMKMNLFRDLDEKDRKAMAKVMMSQIGKM